MNKLSILNILHDTTVDGPGFRTSIYAAGCAHQCKECHNPQSWDINNGNSYSIKDLLDTIINNEFANITFSGGDPLFQVEGFTHLAKLIKAQTNKTIWCYTGFTYEQIISSSKLSQILPYIDVLVDGRFEESLKDEAIPFRGSNNQRIIDVTQSIKEGYIVEWQKERQLQPTF